jgi:hypothetical protein
MQRTLLAAAAGFVLATASGVAGATTWTDIVAPGAYGRVAVGAYDQPPAVYSDQPIVAIAQAVLGAMLGDYGYPQQAYPQPGYGQPVYGQPAYGQPVYQQPPVVVQQAPVYLWVPPVQRTNWAQYCGQYGACNVPVYFVQDRWYQDNVLAHRQWYAQQVAMNRQAMLEQDRIARERWERARWERERAERARMEALRAQQQARWDQARIERDRIEREHLEHVRWEQEHGRNTQPVPAWQPPGLSRPGWDHDRGHGRDHDEGHDQGRWHGRGDDR